MTTTVTDDPYVLKVRREISDLDSSLVELVNKRLRLVSQLKRYKDEHGIGFVDLAREQWMLQYLSRANRGPLTEEGLSELYHYVLDLTKQEVTKATERGRVATCVAISAQPAFKQVAVVESCARSSTDWHGDGGRTGVRWQG